MPTYLQRFVDYNNWANKALLEFLRALPPETMDATAPGVYGSVRETLGHLLTGELRYYRELAGLPVSNLAGRPEHLDLDQLHQMAEESAGNLVNLLEALPEPATLCQLPDGKRAAATILTQLFMHGSEHRAHVGTILGSNGIEPPEIDSWAYGIFVGGDDWPPEWGPEPANR